MTDANEPDQNRPDQDRPDQTRPEQNRPDQNPEQDPLIGAVLQERYLIKERLAAGGMGVIYRGERVKLERQVAIKFLNAAVAANPSAMKRFEREAMTMSRLNHPNCVSVIDIGLHDSAPFIVMDFITGQDLTDILKESGRMSPGRAIHIGTQILSALSHAHSNDMVHRDIKPANIMLTDAAGTADHVFVLDFGLAKFYRDALGNNITAAYTLLGTPSYMSPEQGRTADVGPSSDIYSTGVLLFELITGQKPFTGKTNYDLLQAHKQQPAPSIRERMSQLASQSPAPVPMPSPELDEVLRIAMAKTPETRFADAEAFTNALRGVPEAGTYEPRLHTGQTGALSARAQSAQPDATVADQPAAATQHLGSVDMISVTPGPEPADNPRANAGHDPTIDPTMIDSRADSRAGRIPVASPAAPRDPYRAQRKALLFGLLAVAAVVIVALVLASGAAVEQASSEDGASVATDRDNADQEADDGTAPGLHSAGSDPASADDDDDNLARIKFVRDVEELLDSGQHELAIAGIDKMLGSTHPDNAYLYLMRGNALFALDRPESALVDYSRAIRHKREYASRSVLNNNVIAALARDDLQAVVKRLYREQIRRAGLRYLQDAAKTHDSAVVRQRAAALAETLD